MKIVRIGSLGRHRPVRAAARAWLGFALLLVMVGLLPGEATARSLESTEAATVETSARIQVLDGRISTGGLQLYRVTGL